MTGSVGTTRALASWSGGKDSCLAAHLAAEQGLAVDRLLCAFEEGEDRSRSHALSSELVAAQARALGAKLVMPRADWPTYESAFIAALQACRADGYQDVVFGDIDLEPHREWEEKVCAAVGVTPHLPLWEWPRRQVVEAIFDLRIEAVCVCVKAAFLPQSFCGRPYDRAFIADLPAGVDACGENGEFHTAVLNAPRFYAPIAAQVESVHSYTGPDAFGAQQFFFARLALIAPEHAV